ncbi:MAG: hypothetical protein G01um101417_338 [Parcubacteria group bacterium Gr01-1014_17]|nr:MAG: hypothetical protein G01um101417_338 [Parcubacteria group bacterium Gr01-1014_17]
MHKWMKWTVLEAASKTVVRLLQKVLGDATTTLGGVSAVIFLTGFVQLVMGLFGLLSKRGEKTSDLKGKIGAVAFGLGAVWCNVCALFAFQYGGDVVVITFLTTLSMIPGAFLDRFWFKKRLLPRQWFGLGVGLLAGYVILGCPSLQEVRSFPLWVWLVLSPVCQTPTLYEELYAAAV